MSSRSPYLARRGGRSLHAIEAAQVRAGLGRSDDVVHRNRQLGARQAHVHQGGAQLLQLGQTGPDGACSTSGRQAGRKELARQADAQALPAAGPPSASAARAAQRLARAARYCGGLLQRWWRIALVESLLMAVQQQLAILGRAGHRAGLVEAGGEGDHAVARCTGHRSA